MCFPQSDITSMLDIKALRSRSEAPAAEKSAPQESNFANMLQKHESQQQSIPGVVKGRVVDINKSRDYAVVDINQKAEGTISLNEFKKDGVLTINIGDEVDVFAEYEDDDSIPVLSKEKADRQRVWDKISLACEQDELVKGRIVAKVKGGLSVNIENVKAFLPGSQVDIRPSRNLDKFVAEDHEYEFKVIKFNRRRGNIVLSRRVLLEKDRAKLKAETLTRLKEGNVLDGVVKNITHYGAFIDLGGIDGLLHITDMSWGRVTKPQDVLGENAENTQITVKVKHFDPERERVSLGLKQLRPDPWSTVEEKYQVQQRISGTVVSLTDYGAFLELEEGIEGLIHISEMSWTGNVKKPERFFAIGDNIEAAILDIDTANRRISLGYKQTQENPWVELQAQFPPGSIIQGHIRNITDFGIFVSITQDIDGLVHISDLSWTQKIKHPKELYERDELVEAVVLNVDVENQRFSLGIKQLTSDVWEAEIPQRYASGTLVKGTIRGIEDFGAFIRLDDELDLDGLIHISELSDERVENPAEVVEAGQEVIAEVLSVDRFDRKISLTLKSTDVDAYAELLENQRALVEDEGNFSVSASIDFSSEEG